MNILIVEDDARAARTLKALIEAVQPTARVIGMCRSAEETVQALATNSPDLLFMDIELADGSCFEVFNRTTVASPVVFCTAHDEYMLDAFQANGIAYLLKPIDEQAVQSVFDKVAILTRALLPNMVALRNSLTTNAPSATLYNRSFLIRFRERTFPIAVGEVAAVSLENEVSQLYTYKNERHPLFKTMDEIEESLDPAQFFRISRQVIVGRPAIVDIKPCFNRKVALTLSSELGGTPIVSRLKVTPFLKWMERE